MSRSGSRLKILISAAEASSDVHGAQLLRELRLQKPGLEAFGVGGPKLRAEGLDARIDARELLAMGFTEILGRMPKILNALKTLEQSAMDEKPDLAIVIDYPDFHFKLATRLKALGIPVVYYIPPKVWVWRKKRVERLKSLFARVLCIFPFEEEFFREEGLDVRYVGNPLLDELPMQLTREEARRKLGLGLEEKVLVLLPGSRPSELKQHLETFLDSAVRGAAVLRSQGFLGKSERLRVLLPFSEASDLAPLEARVARWLKQSGWSAAGENSANTGILDIRVSRGDSAECMVAADAGLIKSGTSTLEAALLGCVHTVVYKPNALTSWIYRNVVRYPGPVGLVNLVSGRKAGDPMVAKEILMSDVTVANLSREVISLLTDQALRARMSGEFSELRAKLAQGEGPGPSAKAAFEVLEVLKSQGRV